jgi:polyphosphate kinase
MSEPELKQSEYYINRELSLIEFNRRVLAQAKDESVPLLERIRYLSISSSNLDEFFEVRVSGLKQKIALGSTQTGPDNMSPAETLREVSQRVHELVAEQYRVFNEVLLPKFETEQIRFIRRRDWNEAQSAWLRKYFKSEIQPVLSPMGLDPAHPFPRIINKGLNFIISLTGKDAFGRNSRLAVLQAPRSLPRLIQLPMDETGGGPHDFVFLSSIIHANADDIFYGMDVDGFYQFRVTRNSELFVDDEEIVDLKLAIQGELMTRHYGDVVRLEVAHNCPSDLVEYLKGQFRVDAGDVYQVDGPVNLNRMQDVYDMIGRSDLKFILFTPSVPKQVNGKKSIFDVLNKQDILLHHPYESFLPVIDFVRQAAEDPKVLAIRQTLYRTGPDSAMVAALVKAAQAGKEVTVVIELMARFDEEANVALATRLQQAGAHVVYGVVGFKTHAKMILVVRRDGKNISYYTHLGTGNYHPRTARIYTDYGLFTADKVIGADIHLVFNQLTSLGKIPKLNKILHSPFTLHKSMLDKIEREIENLRNGKAARIILKMNSLTDPPLIQALYRASIAGVKIDLIVRGMCRLKPGVKGISENIRVRSIVGRFLEHARVFYFENGGEPEVYGSSADWMERNMFNRVEVCFPFEHKTIRNRIIKELNAYLQDSCQAWELQSDGSYTRLSDSTVCNFTVQGELLTQLK